MKATENKIGELFLISTPIGNLEDITYRAVRVLKEVDIIAAEDTRKAIILLNKYEIPYPKIISHHVQNEHKTFDFILNEVSSGKRVGVITEAGSPCISDPGFLICREAIKRGIEPTVIPGVSSLIFAAEICALPTEKFAFYGFLPNKEGARRKTLEEIKDSNITSFFFESPYRVEKTIEAIVAIIGANCKVSIVREATKIYEEIMRGTAQEIYEKIKEKKLKGEFVIGVSNRP